MLAAIVYVSGEPCLIGCAPTKEECQELIDDHIEQLRDEIAENEHLELSVGKSEIRRATKEEVQQDGDRTNGNIT